MSTNPKEKDPFTIIFDFVQCFTIDHFWQTPEARKKPLSVVEGRRLTAWFVRLLAAYDRAKLELPMIEPILIEKWETHDLRLGTEPVTSIHGGLVTLARTILIDACHALARPGTKLEDSARPWAPENQERTAKAWTGPAWPEFLEIVAPVLDDNDRRQIERDFDRERAWLVQSDGQPPCAWPNPKEVGFMSTCDLAAQYNLPIDRVRKCLENYRKQNMDCFIEIQDRRSNEPRFLYNAEAVRPAMEHLRRLNIGRSPRRKKSSGKLPADGQRGGINPLL